MRHQFPLANESCRAVLVLALEMFDLRVTSKVLFKICVLREAAAADCTFVWLVT